MTNGLYNIDRQAFQFEQLKVLGHRPPTALFAFVFALRRGEGLLTVLLEAALDRVRSRRGVHRVELSRRWPGFDTFASRRTLLGTALPILIHAGLSIAAATNRADVGSAAAISRASCRCRPIRGSCC